MKQLVICRAENCEVAKALARYRECAARAIELLRLTLPDTFLGRQHHEPIPLPDVTETEMRSVLKYAVGGL